MGRKKTVYNTKQVKCRSCDLFSTKSTQIHLEITERKHTIVNMIAIVIGGVKRELPSKSYRPNSFCHTFNFIIRNRAIHILNGDIDAGISCCFYTMVINLLAQKCLLFFQQEIQCSVTSKIKAIMWVINRKCEMSTHCGTSNTQNFFECHANNNVNSLLRERKRICAFISNWISQEKIIDEIAH